MSDSKSSTWSEEASARNCQSLWKFIGHTGLHLRRGSRRKSFLIVVACLLLNANIVGCSTSNRYVERYEIENLKVVFLDSQSLHNEWEKRTGQNGVRFLPTLRGGLPSVKSVKGFYDFTTDTLYCPKWNYKVCGHELHHAALGHFHDNH